MAVDDSTLRHRISENTKSKKKDGDQEGKLENDSLRAKLSELREDVLQDIKEQLDPDKLLERLWNSNWSNQESIKKTAYGKNKNFGISEKTFCARDSELTVLLKVTHIATIYNVFIATLITMFLNTVIHDLINTGSVNLGFELLSWNFSRFPVSILLWLEMNLLVVGLYYGHCFWAKTRANLHPRKIQEAVDKTAMCLLVTFFVIFLILPAAQVLRLSLPLACSFAVLLEQLRLLMKAYAYIRTNAPRTLVFSPNDKESYFVPSFEKFLYFLLAPTLIYKDSYPRTSHIRWSFVLARFGEVFCTVIYLAFIAERFILPAMRDFGKPGTPFIYIVALIIDNALPSLIGMVCIFFLLLHSWLNGMSELLRFADRMFYNDWWNTTNYAKFYKTWNIAVYDWLHTFIYIDAGGKLFERRTWRALLVIAVSAIFHEYIMAVGLGYFLPGFIFIYGFGGPMVMQLNLKNQTLGNIWIWLSLILGLALMLTIYLGEYYARINCPRVIVTTKST